MPPQGESDRARRARQRVAEATSRSAPRFSRSRRDPGRAVPARSPFAALLAPLPPGPAGDGVAGLPRPADPRRDRRAADRRRRSGLAGSRRARPERARRLRHRRPGPAPLTRSASTTIGRDVFSRTIYGARVSLIVAFLATGLATLVGVIAGLLAGYMRGWIDVDRLALGRRPARDPLPAARHRPRRLLLARRRLLRRAAQARARRRDLRDRLHQLDLRSPGSSAARPCRCASASSSRRRARSGASNRRIIFTRDPPQPRRADHRLRLDPDPAGDPLRGGALVPRRRRRRPRPRAGGR